MKKDLVSKFLTVTVILAIAFVSCNKYYDPPLVFEEPTESEIPKKRKVLLIVAEGATSNAVKTIMPPNISKLLQHAKYSWGAYSDANTSDGGSWVGLVTAKSSSTYGDIDSSLRAKNNDENLEGHGEITYIPSYSQRLLTAGKIGVATSKMAIISPWQTLLEVPFKYADQKIYAENDSKVKDAAISALNDQWLTHLVVDFNGPNLVGKQFGFSESVSQYKEAINTVDGYIGEIMEALKARATYDLEDWLVIVTTTHGVSGSDKTKYDGGTLSERKIFYIFNNENIVKEELSSLPSYQTYPIKSKNNIAALDVSKSPEYALGSSGEYTILTKVKMLTESGGHTVLAFKSNHAYSNTNGWNFMITNGERYRYVMGDGSGGGSGLRYVGGGEEQASSPLRTWDAVALKVYDSIGKRWAVCITNGNKSSATDITGYDIGSSDTPFALGVISNSWGSAQFSLKDFSIWNKPLPDEYIANYLCQQGIPADDPHIDNLIGYWPVEGSGRNIANLAPNAADKNLTTNFDPSWSWESGASCNEDTNLYLSSVDIVPTIFYWLNTSISDAWNIEGAAWLKNYEVEFLGK